MRVTEKKTIKIGQTCAPNPVYVSWKSTKGREYWLFHTVQTEGLITEAAGDFEPYIDNLSTARGQIEDLSILAQPQLTLYALVDNEDLSGFKTILYSVNIEILQNPTTWEQDGPVWKAYRILPGSYKIVNTDEVRSEIELTLNDPYIFNLSR